MHELQVHQVELEMQNEELHHAHDTIQGLLSKYSDLYDFAPVGYLTVDSTGKITNANLTAATLLGADREMLTDQKFELFFTRDSQAEFRKCLKEVFAGNEKQACETTLLRRYDKKESGQFDANIHASPGLTPDAKKCCHLAISDITAIKKAEASERELKQVTDINEKLQQEILQRRAVEKSLRTGEQHLKHLLEQSQALRTQLQQLSHKVLTAQEEERKNLSRELHDVVSQALTSINLALGNLQTEAKLKPEEVSQTITETRALIEDSIEQVHQFAGDLRPTVLDDIGLIPALHSYMENFTKRTGIQTHLTASKEVESLDESYRTGIFRVTQEALTNVARHAKASQALVDIHKEAKSVSLKIEDDGQSFEVLDGIRANGNESLGLLGMRERVEMIGGHFQITSGSDKGTTILAHIPLEQSARKAHFNF